MQPHHYVSIAPLIALATAQGQCRFPNGTLLPDVPEWNIYQPCLAENGPVTTCCALARSNPPYGNISLGFTQDECLPNGLCQNRITSNEGEKITTWFVDYCTEYGQEDSSSKCVNACPQSSQELTAKITPCDGTKNSSRWCCGDNTNCCSTGSGVVLLEQVLGSVSSSVISSSASATSSSSPTAAQASASASSTGSNTSNSGSSGLSGGAIAGIVVGAIAGLALIAATLFFARRASRRKKNGYEAPPVAEGSYPVEAPAYSPGPGRQEISSTVKYANAAEMPGPPPSELHGDAPVHTQKP